MTCFWIFNHEWSKWTDAIEDYSGDRCQFRFCKKCNIQQKRKSYWLNSIPSSRIVELFNKDREEPK